MKNCLEFLLFISPGLDHSSYIIEKLRVLYQSSRSHSQIGISFASFTQICFMLRLLHFSIAVKLLKILCVVKYLKILCARNEASSWTCNYFTHFETHFLFQVYLGETVISKVLHAILICELKCAVINLNVILIFP